MTEVDYPDLRWDFIAPCQIPKTYPFTSMTTFSKVPLNMNGLS